MSSKTLPLVERLMRMGERRMTAEEIAADDELCMSVFGSRMRVVGNGKKKGVAVELYPAILGKRKGDE